MLALRWFIQQAQKTVNKILGNAAIAPVRFQQLNVNNEMSQRMSHTISKRFKKAKLPYHVMPGISAMAAGQAPATALAQSGPDTTDSEEEAANVLEEVVVTGIRGSLLSSQSLRQNSDVFVDGIMADDIGALPDRSVNEVLQRIPGVAITRFAAADDPDHFSVEGSGTTVRGLTFVRSELNGRDVFTADSGQALGFNTVLPKLMQLVQVFKTRSADMIEGGIGVTVNLITRKPFDRPDQSLDFSLEANYGDLRQEWTPAGSLLKSCVAHRVRSLSMTGVIR